MKLGSTASTLAPSRPDFLNSLGYNLPSHGIRHHGCFRAQTGQAGSDFRFPAVCFSSSATSAAPRPSVRWFGCWNPGESRARYWMAAVAHLSEQLRVNC
jgi:hypothetical protein